MATLTILDEWPKRALVEQKDLQYGLQIRDGRIYTQIVHAKIEAQAARIERLEKALRFYATADVGEYVAEGEGARAREALGQ